jgi:Tfp pilus assembly protein PilO
MAIGATQKWYAGAAGASLLVVTAGWFALVSPQQNSAAEITTQAESVTSANQASEQQIALLKEEFKDLPQVQSQVAAIRARIPQTPNEPALLRALQTLAKSSGVTFTNLQVAAPIAVGTAGAAAAAPGTNALSSDGQVTALPLTLEITGTFANTRLFLNGLESMQRSMLVTGLDVSREGNDSGPNKLKTSIASRIFMANPGTVTVAPAAGAAGAVTTPNSPS